MTGTLVARVARARGSVPDNAPTEDRRKRAEGRGADRGLLEEDSGGGVAGCTRPLSSFVLPEGGEPAGALRAA